MKPSDKKKQQATRAYMKRMFVTTSVAYKKPITDEELIERLKLIPKDTRSLTGKVMGDPIPNDPRRVMVLEPELEDA